MFVCESERESEFFLLTECELSVLSGSDFSGSRGWPSAVCCDLTKCDLLFYKNLLKI